MAANWPSSLSSSTTLYTAVNLLTTTLSGNINNSVTTITLASSTGFPTAGAVTIDNEVVFYTGVSGAQLTGCVRGSDGTAAASHNSGVPVGATIVANHVNALTAEVIAIETDLHSRFGYGSTAITVPSGVTATFGGTTTFNGALFLSAASDYGLPYYAPGGQFTGTAGALDGEILIGNTSGAPGKSTITGTANQVVVTNGTHSITLSLPQSIGTGSTPTFTGLSAGSAKITSLANGTASTDAAAFGQLKVLQTVTFSTTTNFSTTSSTFQNTNLVATITPTSASSKILILATAQIKNASISAQDMFINIDRSGTALGPIALFNGSIAGALQFPYALAYLDSPATTSSRTYTIQIRGDDGATTVSFGINNYPQSITLMEVQ